MTSSGEPAKPEQSNSQARSLHFSLVGDAVSACTVARPFPPLLQAGTSGTSDTGGAILDLTSSTASQPGGSSFPVPHLNFSDSGSPGEESSESWPAQLPTSGVEPAERSFTKPCRSLNRRPVFTKTREIGQQPTTCSEEWDDDDAATVVGGDRDDARSEVESNPNMQFYHPYESSPSFGNAVSAARRSGRCQRCTFSFVFMDLAGTYFPYLFIFSQLLSCQRK